MLGRTGCASCNVRTTLCHLPLRPGCGLQFIVPRLMGPFLCALPRALCCVCCALLGFRVLCALSCALCSFLGCPVLCALRATAGLLCSTHPRARPWPGCLGWWCPCVMIGRIAEMSSSGATGMGTVHMVLSTHNALFWPMGLRCAYRDLSRSLNPCRRYMESHWYSHTRTDLYANAVAFSSPPLHQGLSRTWLMSVSGTPELCVSSRDRRIGAPVAYRRPVLLSRLCYATTFEAPLLAVAL